MRLTNSKIKEHDEDDADARNKAPYNLADKYRNFYYIGQNLILPGLMILLTAFSWYLIWYQSQILIKATTLTYQQTQLEITRAMARSVESYVTEQRNVHDRTNVTEFEQEIFQQFIAPVRLLRQGDAWIYAPDHVVFDLSSDFPAEYRGKNMAEIFVLQSQYGASHYKEMTEAVMNAREGVGWYIWLPDKGQEIAAWTPVSVGELVWIIGLSTPLPEILEATGVQTGIWNSYISMGLVTLAVVVLLVFWNNGRRQRDRAETERERLLGVEQEQRLLAETLAQAFLALTSQIDQTKVLDEILKQVQYIVPYDGANIVLIENEVMHFVRWQGHQHVDRENLLNYFDQPLTGFPLDAEVVQSQQAVVIADVQQDQRWITTTTSAWIRSFMALPISLHERVIGLLRLNSGRPHRFSPRDVARLQPLTHAAAIALENARLYEQLRKELLERTQAEQRTQELNRFLFSVQYTGATIASSLDLNYILDKVTIEIVHLLGVERCAIHEWNQETQTISTIAKFKFNDQEVARDLSEVYYLDNCQLAELVLSQKRAHQRTLSQPEPDPAELAYMQAKQFKTILMLPMEAQSKALGLLEISDSRTERIFTMDEVALTQQLANQAAVAIKNAHLYEQATKEIAERRKVEQELRESETKFRILAETTTAAIFIYHQNRNRYVNPAAEAITGYTQAELLAMDFWGVVHPDFRELVKERGRARLKGEAVPWQYELKILTKQQQERWVDVTLGVINFEGEVAVLGTAFDITERKNLVEILAESENRLLAEIQSVLAITRALVTETNLSNLLEFIMIRAKHLTQADGAAVLLLNENSQQFEAVILGKNHYWLEINTRDESRLQIQSNLQVPLKGTLAELAMTTHTIQMSDQVEVDEGVASIRTVVYPQQIQALICAPLTIQSKDLGVLLIWSEQEQHFSEQDDHMVALFADQAALALSNAYLHALNRHLAIEQERQRLARELHDSVTQTLYSIGMAAGATLQLIDQKMKKDIRTPVLHIHQLAQLALKEIREQVTNLYSSAFADHTLAELLEAHCHLLREQYGLAVELKTDPDLKLSLYQRENLYYIAKEALWNVVKHAQGAHVDVSVTQAAHQATLSIVDSGPGFDVATLVEPGLYGLRSMQERAALLGSSFDLESKPGQGTRILVQIPVN